MKTLALLIAGLLLAALAWLVLGRAPDVSPPAALPAGPASGSPSGAARPELAPELAPAAAELGLGAGAASEAPASALRSSVAGLAPEASAAIARTRLRGRVADLAGGGLAGVELRLVAWGAWRDDPAGSAAAGEGGEDGFTAVSGADGRFEFDVPAPTAAQVVLSVEPDRFHASTRLTFGSEPEHETPLAAGERELGRLVLAPAGVLEGRVRDATGAPLVGVQLRPEPLTPETYLVQAVSDDEGRFALERLVPGRFRAHGSLEGFLDAETQEAEVVAGRRSGGLELVLERGASLSGTVVGPDGVGVEDARLSARPAGTGMFSSTSSLADGSFRVFLREPGAHRLEVQAEGFRPLGAAHGEGPLHEPGATGIRLRLERAATTTFVGLDAATGMPLEAFGLQVYPGWGSAGNDALKYNRFPQPEPRPRAEGRVEFTATPRVDGFQMAAPGYVRVLGDVVWDEGEAGVMSVRLERGGSIVGRLVEERAGDGFADARLWAERGAMLAASRVESAIISADGRLLGFSGGASGPAGPADGARVFKAGTDAEQLDVVIQSDGRFELGGLEAGHYRLHGRFGERASIDVPGIEVRPPEASDVGPVRARPSGRIEGVVRLLPGDDPAGLQVQLGDWRTGALRRVGADGRFEFRAVPPGTVQLATLPFAGRYAASEIRTLEVPAGGVLQVEFDLAERATVALSVRLTYAGEPAAGRHLSLDFEGRAPPTGIQVGSALETDADGWARADVVPGTTAHVRMTLAGRSMRLPGGSIELVPGVDAVLELDVRVGAAEIPLPAFDPAGFDDFYFEFSFFEDPGAAGDPLGRAAIQRGPSVRSFGKQAHALLEGPPRARFVSLPVGIRSYRCRVLGLGPGLQPADEALAEVQGTVKIGS